MNHYKRCGLTGSAWYNPFFLDDPGVPYETLRSYTHIIGVGVRLMRRRVSITTR